MMNQRIFKAVLSMIICMGMLAGCNSKQTADLVVYGKIYTAEDNKIAEAFAVKDGKYVYVGDKAGAEAFIEEGKTEVIDYTGKGLVMPGCGNGHAHYSFGYAIQSVGTVMSRETDVDQFIKQTLHSGRSLAGLGHAEAGAGRIYEGAS